MKPAVLQYKSSARHVGRDQPVTQTECFAERDSRRLLRQNRIGPCFDRKTIHVLGADDATESWRGLEELKRHATRGQFVGGRKSRDAAADDCDHSSILSLPGSGIRCPGSEMRTPDDESRITDPGQRSRLENGNWKLLFERMHVLREFLHQLERGVRENAVSKIEDMSRPTARTTEDVVGCRK